MVEKTAPLLLRPEEAADVLRISRAKCYSLIAGGVIPVVRVGRSMRVPVSALKAWIDANATPANMGVSKQPR
jgi:excisionase family DNA binding protein